MSVEARALFVVSAGLLAFGLAVLYSASSIEAIKTKGSSTFYLEKQLTGVLVGAILFAAAAKIDAERWREWAWRLMYGSLFLMLIIVLPFVPGAVAPFMYGSHRFLAVPGLGVSIQPSEFAKLAVIIWTAMLVVKKGGQMRHLLKGLTPFFVVVGALALLAAAEPDFSIALTFLLIMGVILFSSGARIGHFLFLGALGIPLAWKLASNWVSSHAYVVSRFQHLLHPGAGFEGVTPQLKQSLIAVGSGGLLGQGYGQGMQQAGWVSFAYNDFIGSVIGEEWGFVGMLFVIGLYSLYGYLAYRISMNARSRFQELVAVGISFTMVMTAFVHLGVVTGMLPTTGLTLPFISDGRSNLVLSMIMTGILVNIGSRRERLFGETQAQRVEAPGTA
jgi:cell division protein FtsW